MKRLLYIGLGASLALFSFASCTKENSMREEKKSSYEEDEDKDEGTCPVEEAKAEDSSLETKEEPLSLEKEPKALLEEKAKKLEEKVLSLVKESETAPSEESVSK